MISIIIPVHNDPQNLGKCLKSVLYSTYSNYECMVVDDGSSDKTLTVAKEFPVKVIALPQRSGPAFARNYGTKVASSDILFFIDGDVQIYPHTLSKFAETFTTHPEIDAVIGSYDDDPGDASFISQYKNLFHHYVHQTSNVNANTFWSACGAIRREVFIQAGGFNECCSRPAIEDIELGYRLTTNNHKILLQKQIQVKHLKRWTFCLKTDILERGIPWTNLILRNKIFPNDLNLRLSQHLCVVLVYLFLLYSVLVVSFIRKEAFMLLLVLPLGLSYSDDQYSVLQIFYKKT